MRKADNTIVFGSQVGTSSVPPAEPPPVVEPAPSSVRMRPLAEDLIDDRLYMQRPERGLAFAAVSLALIGVAAAGTYFFVAGRNGNDVSTTTTTNAVMANPAENTTPAPTPGTTPAATPAATPSDQPWDKPEVDAVRDPRIPKAQLAKEVPWPGGGPQVAPTERPQPVAPAPPAAPTYAAKIQGAKPAPVQTAKKVPATPPPGMSDEALERAGFYKQLLPKPLTPEQVQEIRDKAAENNDQGRAPSAASTETPSQFTPAPAPSDVMPDVTIKE